MKPLILWGHMTVHLGIGDKVRTHFREAWEIAFKGKSNGKIL